MARIDDVFMKAFYIAKKDARVYYFKAPNFTYGILIPASLFLAFSMAGNISSKLIVAGLTSLVAPVSLFTIILGKALAGFFFGLILAGIVLFPLAAVSGVVIMNPILAVIA